MNKYIYLDNAATTPLAEEVLKEMMPYLKDKYGNASSLHKKGREAREAVERSRETIARKIKCKANEIIFTSGGTESNNFALKGIAFSNRNKGKHIITSKIEHDSVLNPLKWLEKFGFKISYVNVNKEGFVNLDELEKIIRKDTILVSIIHGNNEIGTIQDIKEIGKICEEKDVLFHIDACQSFCKTNLNVKKYKVDLITLNAHKIHGPKGIGALFIKEGVKIDPLLHGGNHERGMRSGTENVAAIVGFGKAVNVIKEKDIRKMEKMRDFFIKKVEERIEKVKLNGPRKNRLCNNINFSFLGVEGESIGAYLDVHGIGVSTGSACASHTLQPSHVLKAIGCNEEEINSTVRFSLNKFTTLDEIKRTLEVLEKVVRKLRKLSPLLSFKI